MKIQEFLKELKYKETNKNIERVKLSHPLQWVETTISIPVWEIRFRYRSRNKYKEHIKYIIASKEICNNKIEEYFNTYINKYNKKYPFRAMSSIEILDMSFLNGIELFIE